MKPNLLNLPKLPDLADLPDLAQLADRTRATRKPSHVINANLLATGPKTPEGKAVSSMNAVKHGLTSKKVILPGEDQEEFNELHDQLVAEHKPEGTLEFEMVSEIAATLWRLHRARAYENHALDGNGRGIFMGGYFGDGKGFDRLIRYMSSIERQLHRTITRLQQLQKARLIPRKAPPQEPDQFVSSAALAAGSAASAATASTANQAPPRTSSFRQPAVPTPKPLQIVNKPTIFERSAGEAKG